MSKPCDAVFSPGDWARPLVHHIAQGMAQTKDQYELNYVKLLRDNSNDTILIIIILSPLKE